jgi:predicted unusual protein kinase regulating ubiquinone biosynthesis (AarF/ABC1/UbiB family)
MTAARTQFRQLRAYGVAARVLASYLWLRCWRPILGPALYDARLVERHRLNARRVERAIVELGGLFVKAGQMISILTNVLPEEFRAELEGLQDALPPRPFDQITSRIRRELGRDPAELFAVFDTIPIASASLAQVHLATLHDGRRVAVKVQHDDMEQIVSLDLEALKRILSVLQMVSRVRGLQEYHVEIQRMVGEELDFTQEAANIERIGARFASDPNIRCPAVVHELSTRRVLTTEFIGGTKVSDVAELQAKGLDPAVLAERILTAYCQMIFVDGVFHADPHPGNIIVQDSGTVAFVDFGAIGRLSPAMKDGIAAFLEGVIARDTARIVAALRQMGFVARDRDPREIAEQAVEYFQRKFLDPATVNSWNLGDVQADMRTQLEIMADLRKMHISFRQLMSTFQVPKDWALLERTILLLLGLCTHLDPSFNPMRTLQPYLEECVLGPDRDWDAMMRTALKEMTLAALTLPNEFGRVLARTNRGDVEVHVPEIREAAAVLRVVGRELVLVALAMGSGTLAYVARAGGEVRLSVVAATVCGVLLLSLLLSLLSARRDR